MRFRNIPLQGRFGLLLILVFWPLNWLLPGLRTHLLFFPLWLGYCLFIDGLVYQRKGHSLLTRDPARYIMLFLLSAPVWWLFELFNMRTQNWFYIGREYFTDFQYFALASLSFSTVIPAVLGTAELVGTWFTSKAAKTTKHSFSTQTVITYIALGILFLILLLWRPDYFFVFLWIALFLIIDPINAKNGLPSLLVSMHQRQWRPLFVLALGCLICGFFWEFWNMYAYPKWIYRVPHVGFWHIFEMPILGYLGYIPFAFELYALYHLVFRLTGLLDKAYLQI